MLRTACFSVALMAAAWAARADTVLRYNGPALSTVSCNKPCHFTHISFTAVVPGNVAGAGTIAFCYGFSGCATPASQVRFADGESRTTAGNAGDFQFSGMLTLDAARTITSGFVAGSVNNPAKHTLVYMDFGNPSGGDMLGGELHGANVDASAPGIGAWTVRTSP